MTAPVVVASASQETAVLKESSCVYCHVGIEEMHPWEELSCVDCHGGDNTTRNKFESHVQPARRPHGDERVATLNEDKAWRRFHNPMDLRIVEQTCGTCHSTEVSNLHSSLHGTTAGHLSDGYYEMGLQKEKGSRYSIFNVSGLGVEGGEVERLVQVPAFRKDRKGRGIGSHFSCLLYTSDAADE